MCEHFQIKTDNFFTELLYTVPLYINVYINMTAKQKVSLFLLSHAVYRNCQNSHIVCFSLIHV